jgi:hypothetical protein
MDGETSSLAENFTALQATLSNLNRYEVALERTFYKALHELQRLQASRGGEYVPPPAAVDVDVTVLAATPSDGADG